LVFSDIYPNFYDYTRDVFCLKYFISDLLPDSICGGMTMTDKSILGKKGRSFSLYLLFSMIVLVIIITGLVMVNDYYTVKNIFDKNSQHLKRQTEQDVIIAIRLTDESFNLYDSSLNEQMRRGFEYLAEEYERSDRTPSRMNLAEVKSKLGEEYDIYIINESGVIEFTTYEPELGLDFKSIPYFFEYLTKIRNSEGFFPDRIVEEQKGSGKIRKFAYMPTPDHRYVLELGYAKTTFSDDRSKINFKEAIIQITKSNPYIERVRIFNSMGKIADNASEAVDDPTKDVLTQLMQQRRDLTIIQPEIKKSVQYLFIDLKNEQYGSDPSRIIEITYNDSMLEKAFFEHVKFIIAVFFLALVIGIFAAFLLSRYLSKPIQGIVTDVNRISAGDLDWKISTTNVTEFRELELSINTMVESLKGYIKQIKDDEILQRDLINNLPVAVFMKNVKSGKYLLWNKKSEYIFSLSADEVIGRTDTELFSFKDATIIAQEDKEACLNKIFSINKTIVNKSHGLRTIHMIIVPIFDMNNNLLNIVGVGEDITEEAQKIKIDLLFSITRRDILDQLSIIINYLERAQLKTSHESMQMFFEKTLESVESIRNQMAFVRSLRDLGGPSPTWQSVKKSFWNAATLISPGKVDISMEMDDIELYADSLLPRVFYNLLANSIQHGKSQMTKIRLYSQLSGDFLTLIYEDNGTGIPVNDKEKIFEFGYGTGTGFGLFLSREILKYTGITITESGEPGKGAKFEIVVPKGKFRKA
jgi:PAS domain S-box-containing protein